MSAEGSDMMTVYLTEYGPIFACGDEVLAYGIVFRERGKSEFEIGRGVDTAEKVFGPGDYLTVVRVSACHKMEVVLSGRIGCVESVPAGVYNDNAGHFKVAANRIAREIGKVRQDADVQVAAATQQIRDDERAHINLLLQEVNTEVILKQLKMIEND